MRWDDPLLDINPVFPGLGVIIIIIIIIIIIVNIFIIIIIIVIFANIINDQVQFENRFFVYPYLWKQHNVPLPMKSNLKSKSKLCKISTLSFFNFCFFYVLVLTHCFYDCVTSFNYSDSKARDAGPTFDHSEQLPHSIFTYDWKAGADVFRFVFLILLFWLVLVTFPFNLPPSLFSFFYYFFFLLSSFLRDSNIISKMSRIQLLCCYCNTYEFENILSYKRPRELRLISFQCSFKSAMSPMQPVCRSQNLHFIGRFLSFMCCIVKIPDQGCYAMYN